MYGRFRSARERMGMSASAGYRIETRYRYNPNIRSLPAMVPVTIPLLLLLLPAVLTALSHDSAPLAAPARAGGW